MSKKMEENVDLGLDLSEDLPLQEVKIVEPVSSKRTTTRRKKEEETNTGELVSCLRNTRVIVRHIPKQTGLVDNPKHILFGGMAENAVKTFVVPRLSSGAYVNVLTDKEKAFLEEIMGL